MALLLLVALSQACAGEIRGGGQSGALEPPGPNAMAPGGGVGVDGAGRMGMRRLTRDEVDNTLRDLLGDQSRPGSRLLPEDLLGPYDNNFTTQQPSGVLVEAVEALAADVAASLLQDIARRDRIVGCKPAGVTDAACLRGFVTAFGRRALRRPLAPAEIDEYARIAQTFAQKAGDFYTGVEMVVRGILQDAEFIYRVEVGAPVAGHAGVLALDDWQVATRLSYFLLGTTPPDALLDAAAAGKLGTPDGIRTAATTLLADPRAADRLDRFHALWLGYSTLPHPPALTAAMRKETAALVKRALVSRQTWTSLLLAGDTFIDDTLAAHYGLPRPGPAGAWVSYGSTGRRGLLSHASFLSAGAGGFADTSPTRRGLFVRTRLFCQVIGSPPPEVKADEPPKGGGSPCKWDRYGAHRAGGSACAGCHEQIDPIGFGLENYDNAGRYRTNDQDDQGKVLAQCPIAGKGEVVGVGRFTGPAELGQLLADNEDIYGRCLAAQMYRFAMGHREGTEDSPTVDEIRGRFKASGYSLPDMLLDVVSTGSFGSRREE